MRRTSTGFSDQTPMVMPRAVKGYLEDRRLCDPVAAIQSDCRELVKGQLPPICLDSPTVRVARNIKRIEQLKLTVDGRVYAGEGGYVIELNSRAEPARRNFTLAHEIAHTFFLPYESTERNRRIDKSVASQSSDDLEERLCNVAAAELLMPEEMFCRDAFDFGPSIQSLMALAQRYGASLMASARRLTEIGPWRIVIACWKHAPGSNRRFVLDWWYAKPSTRLGLIRSATPTCDALLFSALEKRIVHEEDTNLGFYCVGGGPTDDTYFTQAFAYNDRKAPRVITMTILERHAAALSQIHSANKRSAAVYERLRSHQLRLPV